MADDQSKPSGPDLTAGVEPSNFNDDMLLGHVGDQDVLLVRAGSEIFAIDAHCSHYHGPLAEGLVVGEGIRCPWHHACFDLRTGKAARAPALSALSVWRVEQKGGRIVVREKQEQPQPSRRRAADAPKRIVIVGGGAAGFAAAEMLRREQFDGDITMLSSDAAPPVDRPNLSKDYLAGSAPEDWLPLRPDSFYAESHIDLHLAADVGSVDAKARQVTLAGGKHNLTDIAACIEPDVSITTRVPSNAGTLPIVNSSVRPRARFQLSDGAFLYAAHTWYGNSRARETCSASVILVMTASTVALAMPA